MSIRTRLRSVLDFIGGVIVILVMYFAICFLIAAFLAALAGGDWFAAGITNIKNHWNMWADW